MAAKKVYAVKKGKTPGIFDNWEQCKASVEGVPGAEYKGFTDRKEALAYLGWEAKEDAPDELPPAGRVLTYVDGSYEDSVRRYAFGCVFILPDGRIFVRHGNGNNEKSLAHRNVTGEMLGAMYAVRCAIESGFREIEIRYDYEGIEKWVTGAWRAKNDHTVKYARAMRGWGTKIQIRFTKVVAHTNVKYNELADRMAKKGLEEGEGVPPICKIEEMTVWNPCE